MMRSMYAAISGLKVHQTMLDVTSNDIANVNTLGYKSERTTFKDSLSQLQRGASAPNAAQGGSNAIQVGLGVQLGSIDNNMSTGALQTTGNPLDVALQSDGSYFRVANANPAAGAGSITNVQYTRAPATSRATRRATWSPRTASTSSAARPPAAAPTRCCRFRRARPTSRSARTAPSPTTRPAAAPA